MPPYVNVLVRATPAPLRQLHEETKKATTATAFTSVQSQQPQNTESPSPTQAQNGDPTSHNYLTRQDISGIVQQFADIFWNEFWRSSDSTLTGEATPVVYTGHTTSQPPPITSKPPVTVQVASHGRALCSQRLRLSNFHWSPMYQRCLCLLLVT